MHNFGGMYSCDCGHYIITKPIRIIKDVTKAWLLKNKAPDNQSGARGLTNYNPKP